MTKFQNKYRLGPRPMVGLRVEWCVFYHHLHRQPGTFFGGNKKQNHEFITGRDHRGYFMGYFRNSPIRQ